MRASLVVVACWAGGAGAAVHHGRPRRGARGVQRAGYHELRPARSDGAGGTPVVVGAGVVWG